LNLSAYVANGVHTIIQPHELVDQAGASTPKITRGAIRFDNVDFGYGPDRKVFDSLNVTIPPGQRVGLVGFSGSGKSTFVSLILRFVRSSRRSDLDRWHRYTRHDAGCVAHTDRLDSTGPQFVSP
jgi:ABC-type multidrug transport system fused ATPase/permease subunit